MGEGRRAGRLVGEAAEGRGGGAVGGDLQAAPGNLCLRQGGRVPLLLTHVQHHPCLTHAHTHTPACAPVRRADNERAQRQVRELQGRVRATEAQLAPLQQRIRSLQAASDGAAQELTAAREQADRWQKRAQQLMQKYDSVDQQEHQRVLAELGQVQERASEAEAAAATAAGELAALQQQLAAEREALSAARRRLEEAEKENAGVAGMAQDLVKAQVGAVLRAPALCAVPACCAAMCCASTARLLAVPCADNCMLCCVWLMAHCVNPRSWPLLPFCATVRRGALSPHAQVVDRRHQAALQPRGPAHQGVAQGPDCKGAAAGGAGGKGQGSRGPAAAGEACERHRTGCMPG